MIHIAIVSGNAHRIAGNIQAPIEEREATAHTVWRGTETWDCVRANYRHRSVPIVHELSKDSTGGPLLPNTRYRVVVWGRSLIGRTPVSVPMIATTTGITVPQAPEAALSNSRNWRWCRHRGEFWRNNYNCDHAQGHVTVRVSSRQSGPGSEVLECEVREWGEWERREITVSGEQRLAWHLVNVPEAGDELGADARRVTPSRPAQPVRPQPRICLRLVLNTGGIFRVRVSS